MIPPRSLQGRLHLAIQILMEGGFQGFQRSAGSGHNATNIGDKGAVTVCFPDPY